MFFHGIDFEYLLVQYPILNPKLTVGGKDEEQLADRKHLIEKFGFEPVHFLENNYDFPFSKCIDSCLNFGNVVLGFNELPLPLLQLSRHEYGVPTVDVRATKFIFIRDKGIRYVLRKIFTQMPIIIVK